MNTYTAENSCSCSAIQEAREVLNGQSDENFHQWIAIGITVAKPWLLLLATWLYNKIHHRIANVLANPEQQPEPLIDM